MIDDPVFEQAQRIDALADAFEDDWNAGRSPKMESLLASVAEDDRPQAFAALLRVELELRRAAGDTVVIEEYERRFPQWLEEVHQVFEDAERLVDTSAAQTTATMALPLAGALPTEEPLPEMVGRFEVIGKIGEGAFGLVLQARDPQLDRMVAIKVPRRSAMQAIDIDRFLREARAAAHMHHPNICPVYEVGTADGRPYIVMSLVPGRSLAEHLRQSERPILISQAVNVVRKLALALDVAHKKGIVHRDLKPANIMVDRERQDVVVMDFGLARRQHEDVGLTMSGTVLGTPAYMSPEQARGEQATIGPTTDIYSLGVILFELLTKSRPFEGSLAEVLGKILHVEAPGPAMLRPEVGPHLDAIVRKCMAKDPAERFHSMRELADALTAWLKQQGGSSTPSAGGHTSGGAAREETPIGQVGGDFVSAVALEDNRPAKGNAVHRTAGRSSKSQPALWVAVSLAAIAVALSGVMFFARTPTAMVTINVDVDLKDSELSFLLDNIAIPAANLRERMELKVGRHELIVYRGAKTERRFVFDVKGGANPGIAIREDTGPPIAASRDAPKGPPDSHASDQKIEHEFARFVIQQNGEVNIRTPDGQEQFIHHAGTVDDLPPEPFHIVRVRLSAQHELTSKDLEPLAVCPQLRELDIHHNSMWGPEMLAPIQHSKSLESLLAPGNNKFGDAAVDYIVNLKQLKALSFAATNITDAAVARIAQELPQLESLNVAQNPQLTDESMIPVGRMPNLKAVVIGVTPIGNAGLGHLTPRDLEKLGLSRTAVTDEGLAQLKAFPNLRELKLEDMPISDAGLVHLEPLKSLQLLSLTGTNVTPAGIAKLRAAIPSCTIASD